MGSVTMGNMLVSFWAPVAQGFPTLASQALQHPLTAANINLLEPFGEALAVEQAGQSARFLAGLAVGRSARKPAAIVRRQTPEQLERIRETILHPDRAPSLFVRSTLEALARVAAVLSQHAAKPYGEMTAEEQGAWLEARLDSLPEDQARDAIAQQILHSRTATLTALCTSSKRGVRERMKTILEELNRRLDPKKLPKSKKYVESFLGTFGEVPEDVLRALRSPSAEEWRSAIKKMVAGMIHHPRGWFHNQVNQLLEFEESLVRENFARVLAEYVTLLRESPESEDWQTAERLGDLLMDHGVEWGE